MKQKINKIESTLENFRIKHFELEQKMRDTDSKKETFELLKQMWDLESKAKTYLDDLALSGKVHIKVDTVLDFNPDFNIEDLWDKDSASGFIQESLETYILEDISLDDESLNTQYEIVSLH